jgi:hypothetical protein
MNQSNTRWFVILPIAAILLAGFASVAYSFGATSGGPAAHAAKSPMAPGHPALGPGQSAPAPLRGGSAVSGTVAGKTATSIDVTTTGAKTVTIDVSSTTRYSVRGVASPTLADIAVGSRIAAQGTFNPDGSLSATVVQAVVAGQPGFGDGGSGEGGFGGRRGRVGPLPSAGASAPSI